jgi:hypothetical protein
VVETGSDFTSSQVQASACSKVRGLIGRARNAVTAYRILHTPGLVTAHFMLFIISSGIVSHVDLTLLALFIYEYCFFFTIFFFL